MRRKSLSSMSNRPDPSSSVFRSLLSEPKPRAEAQFVIVTPHDEALDPRKGVPKTIPQVLPAICRYPSLAAAYTKVFIIYMFRAVLGQAIPVWPGFRKCPDRCEIRGFRTRLGFSLILSARSSINIIPNVSSVFQPKSW